MATSVPTVIPLDEFRLKVAQLLELSLEYRQSTGDASHFKEAVKCARQLYEEQMKAAANMGWLDRDYLNRVGASIERVEAVAARLP